MNMRTHMTKAAALLLAMAGIAATSAPPHITPTVVITKQADAIKAGIPGATQFFVRTVTIGQDDFRSLSEGGFTPDEQEVKFYYGTGANGQVVGVMLFPQINTTMHGPMEIGLALAPDGTVRSVVLTKATVETKPWAQAAASSGLLARFVGMRPGGDTERALSAVSKDAIGDMPYYMAGLIAQDVARGLAYYQALYAE
jgi:hypothetical protein